MGDSTQRLCPDGLMVRDGPFETHFICLLPEGHDGYHRCPEWGIWSMPDDLEEEDDDR